MVSKESDFDKLHGLTLPQLKRLSLSVGLTGPFLMKYRINDDKEKLEIALLGISLSLSGRERQLEGSRIRKKNLDKYSETLELLTKLKNNRLAALLLSTDEDSIDSAIAIVQSTDYDKKSRATKLTIIKDQLHSQIVRLRESGFSWSECVDFIYDLFTLFQFEDYGQGEEEYDQLEGKISDVEAIQKDRIRKQFVDPASKTYNRHKRRYGK